MSDEVVYRSRVRIERVEGPLRRAYLPAEPAPVLVGVHSEIAQDCPIAHRISPCIAITTTLAMEEL